MKSGVSILCPFFLGEGFPLAFLGLTNQRRPRFRLRIETELVRQLAVFRDKAKFEGEKIVVDLAPAERGITRAEHVDPVANVILSVAVSMGIASAVR